MSTQDDNQASSSENFSHRFDQISLQDPGASNVEIDSLNERDMTSMNEHQKVLKSEISKSSQESNDLMCSTTSTPLGTPIDRLTPISNDDPSSSSNDRENINQEANKTTKTDSMQTTFSNIEEKYEKRILDLQKERNSLQNQVEELNNITKIQEKEFSSALTDMKTKFSANLERANKQAEAFRKDLESMVMKYANSEREVLVIRKLKDELDRKLKDALKDRESLMIRIKGLSSEKSQIAVSLEKKTAEVFLFQKDSDKLKAELGDKEQLLKQVQNQLIQELHSNQQLQQKLNEAGQKITSLQEDIEHLQSSSEVEEEVAEGADAENQESVVEDLKVKHVKSIEENRELTVKIQGLERERLDYEQCVSKLKETISSLRLEIADYKAKVADCEQLKMQLDRERELVTSSQKEAERLQNENSDLISEMESCRHKEGELLEFTERLTAKTVQLQSEHNVLEQKYTTLQEELLILRRKNESLDGLKESAKQEIEQLKEAHKNEISLLVKKVAEKTTSNEKLKTKLDELENENKVMKKRHVTSLKELNKELASMKKRIENYESQVPLAAGDNQSSLSSRTSSSNSLDVTNVTNQLRGQQSSSSSAVEINGLSSEQASTTTNEYPEIDKQTLVDRIVRLQKSLVKRNEKIEFLEEHNHQLLEEMKKKTKLVQYYMLREESGTLATNFMDEHKVSCTFKELKFLVN